MPIVCNQDYRVRDQLLKISMNWESDEGCQIACFEDLRIEALKKLIDLGYMEPGQHQNNSPTVQDFVHFLEKYPAVKAIGYAVSPKRRDYYGVLLTGLIVDSDDVTPGLETDFDAFSATADEIIKKGYLYCWWD